MTTDKYAYLRKQIEEFYLAEEVYWNDGKEGMWRLRHPNHNAYGSIQVLAVSSELIVRGEFGFCYFSAAGHDDTALGTLAWLGSHTDTHYYVKQKAEIALGSVGFKGTVFDEDQCIEDLKALRDVDGSPVQLSEQFLQRARAAASVKDLVTLAARLNERWYDPMEHHQTYTLLGHVGAVTHPSIVKAHLVLRRCYALVKAGKEASCTPTDTSATP